MIKLYCVCICVCGCGSKSDQQNYVGEGKRQEKKIFDHRWNRMVGEVGASVEQDGLGSRRKKKLGENKI